MQCCQGNNNAYLQYSLCFKFRHNKTNVSNTRIPKQTFKYIQNILAAFCLSSACSLPGFYATIYKRLCSKKMTEIIHLQINWASYNNFSEKIAELLVKATNLSTTTNSVDLKCKLTLVVLLYDFLRHPYDTTLGKHCELPQWGLGRSPSRNRIWCILALKSDGWWQQFILLRINWPNFVQFSIQLDVLGSGLSW